jgi:hypothetical protein
MVVKQYSEASIRYQRGFIKAAGITRYNLRFCNYSPQRRKGRREDFLFYLPLRPVFALSFAAPSAGK